MARLFEAVDVLDCPAQYRVQLSLGSADIANRRGTMSVIIVVGSFKRSLDRVQNVNRHYQLLVGRRLRFCFGERRHQREQRNDSQCGEGSRAKSHCFGPYKVGFGVWKDVSNARFGQQLKNRRFFKESPYALRAGLNRRSRRNNQLQNRFEECFPSQLPQQYNTEIPRRFCIQCSKFC